MANTRLELRMKKDAVAYAQGSPLLLEAYALHRDTTSGDCIAQLKWKNIDRRGVRAVMVDLITYDAFNNQINTVQYQYNGLNAAQGAEFGGKTPIIIHDDRIVRFEVALKAVSFADNSVWNAANDGVFEPLPKAKNQSLPDELCDQLARDLAKQGCAQAALYDVQTAHDLWQCGCGSWQKEGDPCLKCHIARQKLAAASDAALLQAHLDEYRVEQEKQRIEAEKRAEAERIERQKREAEAAREKAIQKKKNKRIAAVAGIVLLAIAIICAITFYFVPQSKYKSAMALMQSGSYDEARDAFVAMGGYRDSDYRLQQIEANRAFDAGNYDAVVDIYASLPEAYQDHAEDFIHKDFIHMHNDILAYGTTKTRDRYVKLGTINELEGFTRTDTKAETTAMVSYTYKADDENSPINYVSVSSSPLEAESLTQSSMLQLPSYGYTVGKMHETEVQGYKAYVYSSTIAYYQEPEQTEDAAVEATAEPAAEDTAATEEPATDPQNNTFVQDITMYVDCENDHTLALHVTLKGADESVYVAEDALTDYLKPFTEAFTLLPKTAEAK